MNLRYDLMSALLDCGENRHAQVVMRELGITYQHSTPQSICDQWWFWNCADVPEILPTFLTPMKLEPRECIGHGLSEDEANAIIAYAEGRKK